MDLNIPQKYFILSCNEKGSIRIFKNTRRRAYLAESSFFDLALNDIIDLTDNSVIINKVLPDDKKYLNEFFQIINKNQGKSVTHVLRAMATNEKITRAIYNEIGDSLVDQVDVTKAVTGLVFKTNNYLPNRNVKRDLVSDLRKEILTADKISPEAFASIFPDMLPLIKFKILNFTSHNLNKNNSKIRWDCTTKILLMRSYLNYRNV